MLKKEKIFWPLDSMKLAVESQLEIQTLHSDHLTRWQSQTVRDVVDPSMRGISRMNWLVSYCTARLILVTWSRPNLIIGLIFPFGKKGPIRKENSVECITSLRFSFYQITNTYLIQTTVLNTWEKLSTIRHTNSCVHRYGYLSTLNWNRTGDSMNHPAFLNSIPQDIIQNIINYFFLYFISELLWFMWFMYTVLLPILWKLIYLIELNLCYVFQISDYKLNSSLGLLL